MNTDTTDPDLDTTSNTPVLNRWIKSLPADVQEILMLARDNIEKFDGNVHMADSLAAVVFKRAIEAGAGIADLEPRDQIEMVKAAGSIIGLAARLKEQRIRILDEFKNISDLPKPAALEYIVVEAGPLEQVRRLLALNMVPQAQELARQHGIDLQAINSQVSVSETPEDD